MHENLNIEELNVFFFSLLKLWFAPVKFNEKTIQLFCAKNCQQKFFIIFINFKRWITFLRILELKRRKVSDFRNFINVWGMEKLTPQLGKRFGKFFFENFRKILKFFWKNFFYWILFSASKGTKNWPERRTLFWGVG